MPILWPCWTKKHESKLRDTQFGVYHLIMDERIYDNVTSGLQPSDEIRCLFPQRFALGWMISPFQGFYSNQPSAFSRPTTQQINISTIQRPQSIQGLKARIISAPSRKGGVYWHPSLVRRAEGLNEIHAYFFYCGIWGYKKSLSRNPESINLHRRENPERQNQMDLTVGKTPKSKINRIWPSGKPRKAKSIGFDRRENPESKNQMVLAIGEIPNIELK